MNRIKLNNKLEISRIVHGYWRLRDWRLSDQELIALIQKSLELGVTTFDHADIYGDYSCEKLFGDALKLKKELRQQMQLVTKCGIKLISDKYPKRKVAYYDYSYEHIIQSVENSLKNFGTDYIDLLLLHRPSPFFNPEEVQQAFYDLKRSGKVLNFGVSNFNIQQFEMLNAHLDDKLVTNQVEISPFCLEHFDNGNIDFFMKEQIKPMAWSPLARGRLFNPHTAHEKEVQKRLMEVASELGAVNIDAVAYSWLLKHPSKIIPIVGSHKIERLKLAVDALKMEMTLEQWFRIFIAAKGEKLP